MVFFLPKLGLVRPEWGDSEWVGNEDEETYCWNVECASPTDKASPWESRGWDSGIEICPVVNILTPYSRIFLKMNTVVICSQHRKY